MMKIILVDGDPDESEIVRDYLAAGFGDREFSFEAASDGETAREALSRGGADVLLVDRRLGSGSGVAFLRALRSSGTDVPILFLCDGRHPEEDAAAIHAGATAVVQKPALDPAALRDAVLRVLATGKSEMRLREAEEARRRSEALFEALFSASLDIVLLFAPDGTIRLASPSLREVLGYEPAAVLGQLVRDFLDPADVAPVQRVLAELLVDRAGARRLHLKARRADGSTAVLDAVVQSRLDDPLIGGVIATLRDVTDRERAVEALRRSEELYRLLTETMQDVVWILDAETLRFRYVSPSVERLRGFTPAEVLAVPVDEAVTPEARPALRDQLRARVEAFESGKAPSDRYYTSEVEQLRRDGSTVWTEVVTRHYRSPETGRVEILGVTRDITARKAVERTLDDRDERAGVEAGRRALLAADPAAVFQSPRPIRVRARDGRELLVEVVEGPLGRDRIAVLSDVTPPGKP